jgi:N-acyl-L-homoserine lactone synthetase
MVVDKSNITIRVANSRQIREFQKLLFRIYCLELSWHSKDDFPDGIFTDEYDAVSVFLVVYENKKLVAGVRVVYDSKRGFPHEKVSRMTLPYLEDIRMSRKARNIVFNAGRSKILEVTRFIGQHKLKRVYTYDLMKALYYFAIKNGIKVYFMVVDMTMFVFCHKLGFNLIPTGTPFFCEGSWVIPAIMIVEDMVSSRKKHSVYFLDDSNMLGKWRTKLQTNNL